MRYANLNGNADGESRRTCTALRCRRRGQGAVSLPGSYCCLFCCFLNSLVLGGWFLLQGDPAPADIPRDAVEIPSFENLSSTRRARLSPLKLTAHVHATQRPQASFITLNGERLREGQVAKSGLLVVHIERNGVVLEDEGKRFRLPIDSR